MSTVHNFPGGIHPHEGRGGKAATAGLSIVEAPQPSRVAIPLQQHIGAPCKPLVTKGDAVKTGQMIGEPVGAMSAAVHASISGHVVDCQPCILANGTQQMCVIIDNDFKDEWVPLTPVANPESMTVQELSDLARRMGIVGLGGATFPTAVKLNIPAGKKVDTLVLNGAECEPYLSADHRLMLEHADQIISGARIIQKVLGIERVMIGIEDNKPDAVEAMRKACEKYAEFSVTALKTKYPQGGEKQLVYALTGRTVKMGGLPLDVGAVVCNVSTLTNIAAALDGKKVTEKYVTVGGAVKNPVTLRVPVGISLQELMDAAGGPTCDCKYIIGGPCMGRVVDTLDIPVTKTTGGLLAIPKDHPLLERKSPKLNLQLIMSVCCQCSMCTQMCPRNALGLNVQPHKAMRSLASGGDLLGEFNGIFSCCNCGLCTYYACNFGLKPSQVMQTLKSAIASKGVRPRKEVYGPVDGGLENKKVPVERLIARLGIAEYDVPAPMAEKPLTTSCVRIALRMGVGAPSVPVVAVGDKVRKNQLVADIADKKLGVKMHASISGVVTDITADYIEIRKAAK